MTVFLSSGVWLSVGGDTDLRLFLPAGFFSKKTGAGNAMAAAFGRFSFGSRVQRLQFIRDESRRRNTGEHLEKGGKFQPLRVNAKSSRYTMDILASMKCISVSRLLGFALISLPRKFIIRSSAPDGCTVVFKGINYDFLSSVSQGWNQPLQPLPCFANRPERTVRLSNCCMHLRLSYPLIFKAYKHTDTHTHTHTHTTAFLLFPIWDKL